MYLIESNNLSVGLLNLPQTSKEVPESRLGNDIVRRKDAHAVELGSWVGLGWQVTANDLVFLKTTCGNSPSAFILSSLISFMPCRPALANFACPPTLCIPLSHLFLDRSC